MIKVIALSFILFVFLNANAQVQFGAKAGANYSSVKGIGSTDKSRIGVYGGLMTNINLTKKIFVRPEILYSSKGERFPSTSFNSKGTIRYNYISAPILFGFSPNENISVMAGPEFNFLVNVNSIFDESNHDLTKNFEKVDLAIDAGAAYKINHYLSAEVRYSHGFEGLTEVEYTDNMGNTLRRGKAGAHRVFQLGMTYRFGK